MSRGLFVTVEGVEGAGKSTLIAALAPAVEAMGRTVQVTFEPGATELGRELRRALLHDHDPSPRAELFLYLADRAEHVDRLIVPAVERGEVVICDRFSDATIAYQGYGRGLDLDAVVRGCRFAEARLPDRTYLLDLDPELGLKRAAKRSAPDRMERERLAFHHRVRQGYLALAAAEPARFVVLDATRPANEVAAAAVADLRRLLA